MAQQKIYLTKEGYEEQLKKHTELKEAERKNIIALQEARSPVSYTHLTLPTNSLV